MPVLWRFATGRFLRCMISFHVASVGFLYGFMHGRRIAWLINPIDRPNVRQYIRIIATLILVNANRGSV